MSKRERESLASLYGAGSYYTGGSAARDISSAREPQRKMEPQRKVEPRSTPSQRPARAPQTQYGVRAVALVTVLVVAVCVFAVLLSYAGLESRNNALIQLKDSVGVQQQNIDSLTNGISEKTDISGIANSAATSGMIPPDGGYNPVP